MHGGFESENQNIPENSVMKLDLIAHVKNNAGLMKKIENAPKTHSRGGS